MSSVLGGGGKGAAQAGSTAAATAGQYAQQAISEIEKYTSAQQQAMRGAIQGMGANPYFAAMSGLSPKPVNPNDSITFGSPTTQTPVDMLNAMNPGAVGPSATNPAGISAQAAMPTSLGNTSSFVNPQSIVPSAPSVGELPGTVAAQTPQQRAQETAFQQTPTNIGALIAKHLAAGQSPAMDPTSVNGLASPGWSHNPLGTMHGTRFL